MNPKRIIVTSGFPFIDIDAIAAMYGHSELMCKKNYISIPASSSQENKSITNSVKKWINGVHKKYAHMHGDEYCVVDVSDPSFFDPIVSHDKLMEVIDHHTGFENYWKLQPAKSDIEFIGCCCTKIYEEWLRAGLIDNMTECSAKLMACAILDNTLNFCSKITTDRDRQAFRHLCEYSNIGNTWSSTYFQEVQKEIEQDLTSSIALDLKEFKMKSLPKHFAQLVVWDGDLFLKKFINDCIYIMKYYGNNWIINVVSISHGHNFIVCSDTNTQRIVSELIGYEFNHLTCKTNEPLLRKQFVKLAQDNQNIDIP